ncbi:hypothetical protein [Microcella flavibacter]|uniref:hypothetical protein n=1 Tax=Microcella flavibacter TaxID=1804990 RepID=UPI001456EBBA|nr:hypothetical protein [Microcella flavibacter]
MPASRSRLTLTAVLAAGLVLGTSACTGTPLDNLVEGVVGSGVDQVTEGLDESVRGLAEDVLGGAELSTDGELPASFPQAIPLLGGEIVGGAGGPDGVGWVAQVRIDDAAAFEGARAALEGAGFAASNVSSDPTSAFGTFTGAEYVVNLAIATTNGETTATYVVTPV